MNAPWRLPARAALLPALCLLVACSSSRPVIWQPVPPPANLTEENFMALVDAEGVDPVVAMARVSLAQLRQQLSAKGANAYAVQSVAWESAAGEPPQWRVLLQVQALICSA